MCCCSLWIAVAFCDPLLKKGKKNECLDKKQKLMDPRKHFDLEKMLLNGLHQNQNV